MSMRVHRYEGIHVHIHIRTHTHTHSHALHTHTHTHMRMQAHTRKRAHTHTTRTHAHTHTHRNTHTHTHTHTLLIRDTCVVDTTHKCDTCVIKRDMCVAGMCRSSQAYTHTHTHASTCTHTHTYTHTHTAHAHTHAHVPSSYLICVSWEFGAPIECQSVLRVLRIPTTHISSMRSYIKYIMPVLRVISSMECQSLYI